MDERTAALAASIANLIETNGLDLADIEAALSGAEDTSRPTVREFIPIALRGLPSERSRDSYRTHLNRLANGVAKVCSCTCEACAIAYIDAGDCAWSCKACMENPLEFAGIGDKRVRDRMVSFTDLEALSALAERIAVKRAVRTNVKRRARGLGPIAEHGQGARDTCRSALWRFFDLAIQDGLVSTNLADRLPSGRSVETKRRALTDAEVTELFNVVVSGGNDPELDLLICWASLEMGNRRGGILGLTTGDLKVERQLVILHEKNKKDREQPASLELLNALTAHAVARGGERCLPDHPSFDPTAPVLYYCDSTPEEPHPLARKRYETLHARIQRALPWAKEMNFSLHCARHTAGTLVERIAGTQVARKFLGHSTRAVTDEYTKATNEEIATAFSMMTGRFHPDANPDLLPPDIVGG